MQEKTDGHLPIYVSYSTFTTFLDWLAEMPVMPTQLDRSLWGNKFAGGTGSQLISGLRFLGLLEGEKPTERLEPIVRAQGDQRKHLLADLFRNAYGASVIDGLSGMTPKMLTDEIDKLGATDATARKAFSFVVNAAKANEIPIASTIAKKARNKPSGKRAASGNRKKDGAATPAGAGAAPKPPIHEEKKHEANTRTVELASGGKATVSLSVDLFDLSAEDRVFVMGLIDSLKSYQTAQQQSAEATGGENEEAPGLQSSAAAPGAPERSIDATS